MDRRHKENMHEGRLIYNIQTKDAHRTRTRERHTEDLHALTAYSTLDIFHCLGNNGSYQLRAVKIRFDIIHCKKSVLSRTLCVLLKLQHASFFLKLYSTQTKQERLKVLYLKDYECTTTRQCGLPRK